MRLSQRNEWIVLGALIAYIALVPCPYAMKEFFSSAIGKMLALGTVVFVWKYVSEVVAVLVLVAFLRSGAVREYLENPTPTCGVGQTMDSTTGKCKDIPATPTSEGPKSQVVLTSPPPTSTGPPGGSTPGAAAAAMSSMSSSGSSSVEHFAPKEDTYGGAPFSSL
jgi:hypothetical protein